MFCIDAQVSPKLLSPLSPNLYHGLAELILPLALVGGGECDSEILCQRRFLKCRLCSPVVENPLMLSICEVSNTHGLADREPPWQAGVVRYHPWLLARLLSQTGLLDNMSLRCTQATGQIGCT